MTSPTPERSPVLIGCSHGTRSPAGRRTIALLRLAIGSTRPGLEVVAAHVDVQKPALDAVVDRLTAAGRRCVVVPLLLSTGYHVRHDVACAVRRSGGLAVAAAALGPDPALEDVVHDRLVEAGAGGDDAVVLAAAGSLAPRAVADVEQVITALSGRRGSTVTGGYLAAQEPGVAEAVRRARAERPGARVAVASYLLAPGVFTGRIDEAGADLVAAPLGPDPRIAALALDRYDTAVRAAGWSADVQPVPALDHGGHHRA